MTEQRYTFPVLLFDEKCPLCLRFKQGLDLLPGASSIQKVSIYEEAFFEQCDLVTQEECFAVVHLIDENMKVYQGPEVLEYLIKKVPLVNKLAWLLETDAGKKGLEIFYESANTLRLKLKSFDKEADCEACHKPAKKK
jgi:predicted DCC family thiol-disulfide oxidoreductase YuxK